MRKLLEAAVTIGLGLALVMVGFIYKGVPAAQVVLNDGGVWVVNTGKRLVGHLNAQSRTLDGGLRSGTASFDLSQSGYSVLIDDQQSGALRRVDPSTITVSGQFARGGLTTSHGAGFVGVADPKKGLVWALAADALSGFDVTQEPLISDVPGVRVVTSTEGIVYAVTPKGKVQSLTWSAEPGWEVEPAADLQSELGKDNVELITVGDSVVALDRQQGLLITADATTEVDGAESVQLQPSGPSSSGVLIATDDSLMSYPIDGGRPSSLKASGGPGHAARPVLHDGCSYGVWGESGSYVRDCPGEDDDVNKVYDDLAGATDLSFRTNRRVIVINDNIGGGIYLPNDGMSVVDNWDLVKSQVEEDKEDDATSDEELNQASDPEYTDEQTPPTAKPDEFGVRPGEATTLPVLANDFDADGDVLTAQLVKGPAGIPVVPTKGARGLRVDVPGDTRGSFTFTYKANDGQSVSAPAQVTVRVRDKGTNNPPKALRTARLSLAERSQVTYSVLPDWNDPDGDQIFLSNASGPKGMKVTFRQDGTVTVKDLGTIGQGLREIEVTVSDGREVATGVLQVQVTAYGVNRPPVANADHYWANVDETVVVSPLSNDTDPNGDELALTEISEPEPGTTLKADYSANTFQFSAEKAGTYFVTYSASDGPSKSQNEVRIDVTDPTGKNDPPVAENDLTLLPEGSVALVDVLANDSDPLGGVLVLQSVNVPDTSGLSVETVNHSQLRVSAAAGLDGPTPFTYTISNGHASAVATVMVLPLAATGSSLPPIAVDDEALVRGGDIVAVRVLKNDYSPTNMELTLLKKLEVNSSEPLGDAFVSGNLLRFRAAKEAGQARVTYTIQDSAGNVASAEVRITVVPFEKKNQLPQPDPVVARVVAGNTVMIPVPLDGVDPDGDSVQLQGFASPATLGEASIDRNYIAYTAFDDSAGTETFRYAVKDRFGGEGVAQVRVGIAPAPDTNQNPVAVLDAMAARPGHEIEIDVTANDLDPDGDDVTLVADSVEPVDKQTTTLAEIRGQKVFLTTPDKAGILQYYYKIGDNNGGTARGVITVLVDEGVPPVAPVAMDDSLSVEDVAGKSELSVDVLSNDSDPDGSTSSLSITVEAPARVNGDQVVVPVTDERQVILYTITDPDSMSAKAAVIVPAADQVPPILNPDRVPTTIKGGETLTIDLDDYVITREGHRASLTSTTKVISGDDGDGADLVKDDRTLVFTPDAKFIGDTFVAFEVTDGKTIEDPRGLTATLSLPIKVESSGLFPPVFRPSEATVSPGESAEAFNLKAMVDDPDPGDNDKLKFSLGTVSGPFDVSVQGGNLMVATSANTNPGAKGSVQVSVTDTTTDAVTATVPLRVITSTRPLITTRDAEIKEARSGKPSALSLDSYVTNPFADRGEPVTLVGTPSVSPGGAASVSASGLNLTITPSASFNGQLVVSYQVQDATKDASRHVTGVVRVTVKGNPDAPQNVQAVTNASKSSTVSWTAGDLRGGVLKGFTVYWAGGSKDCGIQTVCELNRLLQNNRPYTFTVTQTTEVAESTKSAPSNEVRPDVKPNAPSVPVAQFGDQSISLTWKDGGVPDGGSPVDTYTVQIRPSAGGVTEKEVSAASLEWTGLKNGTAYEFRVQAHNQFEKPSEWSGFSAPEIPAGQPGPPAAPKANKDPVSAAAPRATVAWSAPALSNGDTSYTYELRRSGTTTVLYSGSGTSTTVTMAVATQDQTFEVRVTNKSKKWSDWSPRSNAVRAFQTPGTPQGFSLTPTGANNTAKFTFGAAAGNGAKPSEIRYQWRAGGASGNVTSGQSITNGAFRNGVNVTVRLQAISFVNGEQAQGSFVSASVNAYGPPIGPAMSCSSSGDSITCSWNGGRSNGRTTTYQANTTRSSSGSSTVGPSGSKSFTGLAGGSTRAYCVRALSAGLSSSWSCDSATTPQPSASIRQGGGNSVIVTTRNWGSYPNNAVRCWNASSANYQWATDFRGETRANVPSTGSFTVTCPQTVDAGEFSLEIVGIWWSSTITWK